MKCLNIFVLFAMTMASLAIAISATSTHEEEAFLDMISTENSEAESSQVSSVFKSEAPISLRGTSRFLAKNLRAQMTCNKYPRICQVRGSPGPDCCKKKCVNVLIDRLNCGMCGEKCKYSEICCKGECVNPLSNRKHCGGCNNKCIKGSSCVYGMCSYA